MQLYFSHLFKSNTNIYKNNQPTTTRFANYSLPSFRGVEEELTLAVVNWLCWNRVFCVVRLDGVGHLGRVGGQRNHLQVFTVTLDVIRS